jgi:acetyl esterase/lipase
MLPQEIVMAGDSAGTNLLLATLMMLRDQGHQLPAAAVCISPITDLECTGESFYRNDDPALTVDFVLSTIRTTPTARTSVSHCSPHFVGVCADCRQC